MRACPFTSWGMMVVSYVAWIPLRLLASFCWNHGVNTAMRLHMVYSQKSLCIKKQKCLTCDPSWSSLSAVEFRLILDILAIWQKRRSVFGTTNQTETSPNLKAELPLTTWSVVSVELKLLALVLKSLSCRSTSGSRRVTEDKLMCVLSNSCCACSTYCGGKHQKWINTSLRPPEVSSTSLKLWGVQGTVAQRKSSHLRNIHYFIKVYDFMQLQCCPQGLVVLTVTRTENKVYEKKRPVSAIFGLVEVRVLVNLEG